MLFCLAGDLIIFDSKGGDIIRRIPHVPLVWLVKCRIDRLLESTQVTSAAIVEDD